MGRQYKDIENIVYHQRLINVQEVETTNLLNRGSYTDRKKFKALTTAVLPQMVRDINTEIGIIVPENKDISLTIKEQKEMLTPIVKEAIEPIVEHGLYILREQVTSTKVQVTSDTSMRARGSRPGVTDIFFKIAIDIQYKELDYPLTVILEYTTDLKHIESIVL